MSDDEPTRVAIACQGGGSHTAFTAGVLRRVLRDRPADREVVGLSGASGGAICALLAWYGLRMGTEERAAADLDAFWRAISARSFGDAMVNDWVLLGNRLSSELGSYGVSPYYNPLSVGAQERLRETVERYVDLDAVDERGADGPDLYVGAADVEAGTFEVFENGEAGVGGVLASAAVPTLFRAVEVDGRKYWDGLFSQNPPIRHFVTEVDPEEKPDEIWIVRINPHEGAVPTSMNEIMDRRNELSGNLSLEQEKHTIEVINRLLDDGVIDSPKYKHVDLREVELGLDLDVHSKLDRSPEFVESLMERGEERAPELWA